MASVVRRFLDVSTGHLTEETRQRLEDGEYPSYTLTGEHGWFVYVPDPELPLDLLCDDMADVFEKARKEDCDYVLFDAAAEIHPELPYFEDEEAV